MNEYIIKQQLGKVGDSRQRYQYEYGSTVKFDHYKLQKLFQLQGEMNENLFRLMETLVEDIESLRRWRMEDE